MSEPQLIKYTIFGMTMASELTLPEAPLSDRNPDVCIRFGKVPDQIQNPCLRGLDSK